MDSIFEAFKTFYLFIIAFLKQDTLFYVGISILLLMVLWSVITLLFSYERKITKTAMKCMEYLKSNTINAENYPVFTALWKDFPLQMKRAWKRYEIKKTGLPSDYITQTECLDTPLYGGIKKQNRSLMKSVIVFSTMIIAFLSISIIGLYQADVETEVVLTSTVLCEALLMPLIFLLLLRVNYYIYTLIRQNQYTIASDTFNDFVDMLDENIDLNSIFYGAEESIGLIRNIYENQTLEYINNKNLKKTRNINFAENNKKGKELKPVENGVIGAEKKSKKMSLTANDEVVVVEDENEETKKITNNREFKNTMSEVEMLLERRKEEKDAYKLKEINDEINNKVAKLTAYKNNRNK